MLTWKKFTIHSAILLLTSIVIWETNEQFKWSTAGRATFYINITAMAIFFFLPETGFLSVVLTALKSRCRSGWFRTQRSACLWLSSAGIKHVSYQRASYFFFFNEPQKPSILSVSFRMPQEQFLIFCDINLSLFLRIPSMYTIKHDQIHPQLSLVNSSQPGLLHGPPNSIFSFRK